MEEAMSFYVLNPTRFSKLYSTKVKPLLRDSSPPTFADLKAASKESKIPLIFVILTRIGDELNPYRRFYSIFARQPKDWLYSVRERYKVPEKASKRLYKVYRELLPKFSRYDVMRALEFKFWDRDTEFEYWFENTWQKGKTKDKQYRVALAKFMGFKNLERAYLARALNNF